MNSIGKCSYRCFFSALSYSRFVSSHQAKPFNEIPGPRGLPIVGSLFDMKRSYSKAGDEEYFHQLLLKFGPIVKLSVLGKPMVVVGGPDAAAKVFRAEGKYPSRNYVQSDTNWLYAKADYPPAMIFAMGEDWKHLRSSASKQIVPRRVANYAPGLCEIGDNFVEHIRDKRGSDGYVEDVNSALIKWAFQGIGYMVFGEKLDTFDESRKDLLEFEKISLNYSMAVGVIGTAPPLYRYFPTKPYRDYRRAHDAMYEKGSDILKKNYDKMVDAINSGVVDETKAVSLMEQWLIEGKLSQREVLMLSCIVLAGGVDSTPLTATFLLHELAKQPLLQEKLHQEVTSVMGERTSPTFDDLQKMTLVRSCIKEILRFQPPLPIGSRIVNEDVEICGYHIPAKTQVLFSTYTASRDPKYVEEPTSFKPERWIKDSTENMDAFISLPFGFGPRSCYGRRLAEIELYILLAKISQNFRLCTKQQSLRLVHALFTRPDELVKIKFTDRK